MNAHNLVLVKLFRINKSLAYFDTLLCCAIIIRTGSQSEMMGSDDV